MSTTDRFKQDNLDFIQAVASWPVPCYLPMKRYSDENAGYQEAVLRYRETDGAYIFYQGVNLFAFPKGAEGQVVSLVQIGKLIDDGWMVD